MRNDELRQGPAETPEFVPSSDPVWNSRIQWGAILAGTFAGVAVTILMATIGAAIGITAGAVGMANTGTVSSDTAGKAAAGFGIGAGVWILLTALAAGVIGGWALNSTARRDRAYSSVIFGGITWSVGVCLMLALASPGMGGILSGLGAGAGGAAAAADKHFAVARPGTDRSAQESDTSGRGRTDQAQPKSSQPLTDEEKAVAKDAADKAAATAATAAWFGVGALFLGLIATILAAGRKRHTGARVVTEIRPRPVPMA